MRAAQIILSIMEAILMQCKVSLHENVHANWDEYVRSLLPWIQTVSPTRLSHELNHLVLAMSESDHFLNV